MNPEFTGTVNAFNAFENNGGLNTTASPLAVKDFESTDLQNVELDIWGSIKKRKGYLNLNETEVNSGAPGLGIHYYENSSGTDYLVGVFGDKIYKMDDLDGTFDDITGAFTLTDAANNRCQFMTYNDTLFGTNNTDLPFKWTGTGDIAAMDVPTDLTKAKCIGAWTEYCFLGNVIVDGTLYSSRVYWSAAGDPTSWDSADWVQVNKNDGQDITAIMPLGDKLVIFKERAIYVAMFTGDTDIPFIIAKSPSHVGCIARDSVQLVNNGLIFLSYDGFYYFDGSNSLKISNNINKTLREDVNTARFSQACSTLLMEKNQYICFMTTGAGSTNDVSFVWDFYTKAWMKNTGAAANVITTIHVDNSERPYFLDYDGFCYKMNIGNNDYPLSVETAIDAYYKTKWFSFGDLMNQKGIPTVMMFVKFDTADLRIGYAFDFEEINQYIVTLPLTNSSADVYDTAVYDTATYSNSGGFSSRIDLTGRGRVFRLSFENNSIDETFTINGFGISAYLETAQ